MNEASPFVQALQAWRDADEVPSHRRACVDAMATSVLYVCSPTDSSIVQTGYEPIFRLASFRARRWVVTELPEATRESREVASSLFAFSTRHDADAWSGRVAGFAAEPVSGAVAIALCRDAQTSIIVDPNGEASFIPTLLEMGFAPQRIPSPLGFADALDQCFDADSGRITERLMESFRDTVFHVRATSVDVEIEPGPCSLGSLGNYALAVWDYQGQRLVFAETEPAAVMDGCDGEELGAWRCLAVDGPGLVAAAAELDAGLMLCRKMIVARDQLHALPERALSRADF